MRNSIRMRFTAGAVIAAMLCSSGAWPAVSLATGFGMTALAQETESQDSSDGAELVNIDFEDGGTDGFNIYTNGGECEITNTGGALDVAISKCGSLDYANQVYWDGFALDQNCVYTYSFDIACDIECQVEYRLQLNGGDYHAYVGEWLDNYVPEIETEDEVKVYDENKEDPEKITIKRDISGDFVVSGKALEKLVAMTNFLNDEALRRFQYIWRIKGIDEKLKARGIKEGDTVHIGSMEFEWRE